MIKYLLTLFFIYNISASVYYVDNTASGANNGTSWANAWESLADISWGEVSGGDILYISGGSTSKTYSDQLSPQASGTSGNSIYIRAGAAEPSPNSNHAGIVRISPTNGACIELNRVNHVVIDGDDGRKNKMEPWESDWSGGKIYLTGGTESGVHGSGNDDIKLLGIKIYRVGVESNDHGIDLRGAPTNTEIAYCDIQDAYGDGIKIYGHRMPTEYDHVVIHHSWIRDMTDDATGGDGSYTLHHNRIGPWDDAWGGSGHPDGVQAYAGYLKIYNNFFYCDRMFGGNALIFLDPFQPEENNFDHVRVYNNLLVFYGTEGNDNYMRAIYMSAQFDDSGHPEYNDIDDVAIFNNTIIDAPYYGIQIHSRTSDGQGGDFTNIVVKNNIIYNSATNGSQVARIFGFNPSTSDIDFDHNVIHPGNSGDADISWLGENYSVSQINVLSLPGLKGPSRSNITSEPNFVSYLEGGDYLDDLRLPANDNVSIDAGEDMSVFMDVPEDYDGVPRPQGSAWDIGAFEYNFNSPSVPKAPENLRIKK